MNPTDVSDLEARRALRQSQPADAADVVVVLPWSEGDTAHALGQLEELLAAIGGRDLDDSPLPAPFAHGEAARALGHLASAVAGMERAAPPTQPIAVEASTEETERHELWHGRSDRPSGLVFVPETCPLCRAEEAGGYELVPLLFLRLSGLDVAHIVGASELLATPTGALPELVRAVVENPVEADRLVATAARLAQLLQLPWDDDARRLHARLDPTTGAVPRRVALSGASYAAYTRLTERILATWHANDTLDRFVYRQDAPDHRPADA